MKPLLDFDTQQPLATTFVGVLSGVGAWLAANTAEITGFAGMVGAVGGACITLLVLSAKIVHSIRRVVKIVHTWRRNRAERLRFRRLDPTDDLP